MNRSRFASLIFGSYITLMPARSNTYRIFTRFLATLTLVAGIWPFLHHACMAMEQSSPAFQRCCCAEKESSAPAIHDEHTGHHQNSPASDQPESCNEKTCCENAAAWTDLAAMQRSAAWDVQQVELLQARLLSPTDFNFFRPHDFFPERATPRARSQLPLHILHSRFLN